jgi:hypothetical protein
MHTRLSCKIDYLLWSNHRDRSVASEFFTADHEKEVLFHESVLKQKFTWKSYELFFGDQGRLNLETADANHLPQEIQHMRPRQSRLVRDRGHRSSLSSVELR